MNRRQLLLGSVASVAAVVLPKTAIREWTITDVCVGDHAQWYGYIERMQHEVSESLLMPLRRIMGENGYEELRALDVVGVSGVIAVGDKVFGRIGAQHEISVEIVSNAREASGEDV